eukprot:TRINITY_DN8292_c0_g1_i2.p1 TRINITY_DN8292_c0_g1~~TRINITY_DN8292_c0_g1_i2.p1  ORF type:complete len:555 (+),score=100.01 TRINITY_DN8292_c0_g1_i2:701-2365(+)
MDMFYTSQVVGDMVVAMPDSAGTIALFNVKSKQLEFVEHEKLKGDAMFRTSQVVGDTVVGMPFCAGTIALFNVKSKQLEFVEHETLKRMDMFYTSQVVGDMVVAMPDSAGTIALFNVKSKQLEFVEHEKLKGKAMFYTSQVVGDMVVAMPDSAGTIALFNVKSKQLEFVEHEKLKGKQMFRTSQVVGDTVVAMPSCAGTIALFNVKSKQLEFVEHEQLKGERMIYTSPDTVGWPWCAGAIALLSTVKSLESSSYDLAYRESSPADTPGEFWMTTVEYLSEFYRYKGVADWKAAANEFQSRLEKDVLALRAHDEVMNLDKLQNLLKRPEWIAARAWSAAVKCKIFDKEWCGIKQMGVREDDEVYMAPLAKLFRTMNKFAVADRHLPGGGYAAAPGNPVPWPASDDAQHGVEEWTLFRGGRLPDEHRAWYEEMISSQEIYRVPMALASSLRKPRAIEFMWNYSYPSAAPHMLVRMKLSKDERCWHVNCIECLTKVADEHEFWFPPYSAFKATNLELRNSAMGTYWELTIEVIPSNRTPADVPAGPVPVNAKLAPWA